MSTSTSKSNFAILSSRSKSRRDASTSLLSEPVLRPQ